MEYSCNVLFVKSAMTCSFVAEKMGYSFMDTCMYTVAKRVFTEIRLY